MARYFRILSFDGGGIRGIVPALWLAQLESNLDSPVYKNVDLLAGTSTGSILACALGLGLPADDAVELYREHGRAVFPADRRKFWTKATHFRAPKYSAAGLELVMQTVFGDALFGEMRAPTMVITYNLLYRKPLTLKSWKPEHQDLPIWRIVTASCSAPTYFPAHVMKVGMSDLPLVDGGIAANNPAACALAEAIRINRENHNHLSLDDIVVGSFGTGETTDHISIENALTWGPLKWISKVSDIFIDGGNDTSNYITRQIIDPERYIRFQTMLKYAANEFDNAEPENIDALISTAQDFLSNRGGRALIEHLAAMLLDETDVNDVALPHIKAVD